MTVLQQTQLREAPPGANSPPDATRLLQGALLVGYTQEHKQFMIVLVQTRVHTEGLADMLIEPSRTQ